MTQHELTTRGLALTKDMQDIWTCIRPNRLAHLTGQMNHVEVALQHGLAAVFLLERLWEISKGCYELDTFTFRDQVEKLLSQYRTETGTGG